MDEIELGIFAVKKLALGDDARRLRQVVREVKGLESLGRRPFSVGKTWENHWKTGSKKGTLETEIGIFEGYKKWIKMGGWAQRLGREMDVTEILYWLIVGIWASTSWGTSNYNEPITFKIPAFERQQIHIFSDYTLAIEHGNGIRKWPILLSCYILLETQVFRCQFKVAEGISWYISSLPFPVVPSFLCFSVVLRKLRHMNVIDYKHSWLEIDRHSELCPYVPFLYILMVTRNASDQPDRSNWPGDLPTLRKRET